MNTEVFVEQEDIGNRVSYCVIKLVNRTEPQIGKQLTQQEVQDLITVKVRVTVTSPEEVAVSMIDKVLRLPEVTGG